MQTWLPWILRLAWVATAAAGWTALAEATDDRSDPVRLMATWGPAAIWVAGVAAMAVPAVASLTATRVVVPLAVPIAALSAIAGAGAVAAAAFVATAVASATIALSADLGRSFVQASAYGDESRFPLRAPVGFVTAGVIAWAVWAALLIAGPLLLVAGPWYVGAPLTVLALLGTIGLARRWHLLARRWLVLVPVGLVVHDPVVLGETIMLRTAQLAGVGLAPAGTEALDLSGPAAGHAVEVRCNELITALLPATKERPTGKAVHVRSFIVAPTRPGRFLDDAAGRGLRLG